MDAHTQHYCYERTTLVGAGAYTGPYGAFVYSGVKTRVDCYENAGSFACHCKANSQTGCGKEMR